MLHPPKRYVVLKVLTENTAMYFSKRALLADTARNKWLKKALAYQLPKQYCSLLQLPANIESCKLPCKSNVILAQMIGFVIHLYL